MRRPVLITLCSALTVGGLWIAGTALAGDCTPRKPSCMTYMEGLRHELSQSPDDPMVYLRLARAWQMEGDRQQTLKYLGEYLLRNTDDVKILMEAGQLAASLPDFDLAEKYFSRALSFPSAQDEARKNLGLLTLQNDKPERSIEHYETVLEDEPDNAEALSNIGIAYLKTGRLEEATTSLYKAAQADRDNPDRFNMLGLAYIQLKRYPDAAKALERATALEPGNIAYHYNLGEAYRLMGLQDKALSQFDAALQNPPRTADEWFNQGKVHFRLGLYESAIKSYQTAEAMFTRPLEKAQVYLGMGYTYEALSLNERARAAFQQYLDIIPDGDAANGVRARLSEL